MELINKYNGAVFFVDMLGIGALTNNLLKLNDNDYGCWLDEHHIDHNPQYLAAALLAKFREVLVSVHGEVAGVTISQLSDCAFIWSQNITDVVLFASKFMNMAIYEGLLCRGGLAYGEIVETQQDHSLGRFIVGNAVTAAANLEKTAKGARVLINQELPIELWEQNKKFSELIYPVFAPFTNPLDYTVYDEFKWYLCPDITGDIESLSLKSNDRKVQNDKLNFTKQRLKIANFVRCSPKFGWNDSSNQGLIQVIATINFIAENMLLDVYHDFDWSNITGKRSNDTVLTVNRMIDEDEAYKIKLVSANVEQD